MHIKLLGAALALCLVAGAAEAATESFVADLKGADEVPPNDTTGTGHVTATLDTATRTFRYTVTYSGLTGPAMAAHFHGPAAPGANAPPMVMVKAGPSPMTGSAQLTDTQIGQLTSGQWYFNIHTAAHPGGEIRGQLQKAP